MDVKKISNLLCKRSIDFSKPPSNPVDDEVRGPPTSRIGVVSLPATILGMLDVGHQIWTDSTTFKAA